MAVGAAGAVGWARTSDEVATVGRDVADALAADGRGRGRVATLVLPADMSWGEGGQPVQPRAVRGPAIVGDDRIEAAATVLRGGGGVALLLGGDAPGHAAALDAAWQVGAAVGARVLVEVFPTRLVRRQAVAPVDRLAHRGSVAAHLGWRAGPRAGGGAGPRQRLRPPGPAGSATAGRLHRPAARRLACAVVR